MANWVVLLLLMMNLVGLLSLHTTCKAILDVLRQLQGVRQPDYTEDLNLMRGHLRRIQILIMKRQGKPTDDI
jgi:hypothetical protein